MDHHEIVSAIKALALEIGRTPSRAEAAHAIRGFDYQLKKLFGTYIVLLEACGLDPLTSSNKPKIDNRVFEKSIDLQKSSYNPESSLSNEPYASIAVISDIHWPWANDAVLSKFYEYVEDHKPEWVILNGDAWDMYSHSKFPRSHNVFTPRDERGHSRKSNEDFWSKVRSVSPISKCYQLLGNHDARPLKQVLEHYPAAEDWVEKMLREEFTFNGVTTIYDPREELMIGNIMVHHGYRSKLGEHRDFTHYHAIVGHTHVGGVAFRQIHGQVLWELNSGFAGDPKGKGLTYTPQKITNWTPGFGAVDSLGARFIHC